MLMHNPPHPGEFIRRVCLDPLELTVTEAAEGLGVSRNTFSMLLNGRLGISPEMAIRLSKGFGGSPETWLQQQMQYDLWHALQRKGQIKVRKFGPPSRVKHRRPQSRLGMRRKQGNVRLTPPPPAIKKKR